MSTNYFKTKFGLMYYEVYDSCNNKDKVVLLLHGWGMSGETFRNVINSLKENNKVVCVDMLGFGRSDEPISSIKLIDYVNSVKSLADYLKIKRPIIIGHSFGGRVAIYYGALYEYEKIFLVNTPAFKNKSIKYYLKVYKYKIKKNVLKLFNKEKYYDFIHSSGSLDYKMCSCVMKGTFKNIVRKDLKDELKRLKGNVVIISSVGDTEVRYKDNVKMYKLIDNSEMYVFYASNHFCYIEEYDKFINIVNKNIN